MDITAPSRPAQPCRTDEAAAQIASAFGPRPALSIYGPGGSRREISGAVLENWAAKTANLLTEELETAAGERLDIQCSWGWRPVALALGAWAAGLVIATDPDEPGQRHLASDSEARLREHLATATAFEWTIAVPAGDLDRTWTAGGDDDESSLASRFPESPETLVDYAALVAGFGDVFQPFEPVTGSELSLPEGLPQGTGAVVLDRRSAEGPMSSEEIAAVCAVLSAGRGVVVITDPGADAERIAQAERGEIARGL